MEEVREWPGGGDWVEEGETVGAVDERMTKRSGSGRTGVL